MFKANVFEVKAKLSEYLDRVARGERIVICRHNKPIAELRPIAAAPSQSRTIGPIPGRPTFEVPSSFFEAPSAEELEQWEGAAGTDPLLPARPGPSPRRPSRVAESRDTYSQARRTRGPRGRS